MCPISSPTVRRSGSHAAIVFVLGVLSGVPTGPMAAQTYAMKTTAAVDYIATRAEREEMVRRARVGSTAVGVDGDTANRGVHLVKRYRFCGLGA